MFDPDLDPAIACYHEAGHAYLAHRLGGRVVTVTIEHEDDGVMGRTTVHWRDGDAAERRRRSALVALAGPVAEALWRGELESLRELTAWRADFREVQQALRVEGPPAAQAAQLHRWLASVREELDDPDGWERLCRIADQLEAHGTLDEDLLGDVFAE